MLKASPLVSVGIPVYNEAKFLRPALESLLAQDYPNIEILICDNASTDSTAEICREFSSRDSRIIYRRFTRNIGAHENHLATFRGARGQYYMFGGGHDMWHTSAISTCVQVLESEPRTVLCYPQTVRIDYTGEAIGTGKNSMDLRGMPTVERVELLINNISGGDIMYGVFRRKALQGLDLSYKWGLDQVQLVHLALQGDIAYVPQPLFYWRKTEDEGMEHRRKVVPVDYSPTVGGRLQKWNLVELWQQMGEASLEAVNASCLHSTEKQKLKDRMRDCFTRRYGVQWNNIVPYELKSRGENVLFATSAAPDKAPFSTSEKRSPIGVGFLISVLRDAGHNVFFIDNYLKSNNFLETDYLQRHQIDFVGIYTNTICFRDSLRMLYRLEDMRQQGVWGGKIVVGGPHASVSPETIPDFVDHIVIGEGEYAFRDIVAGKVDERIVQYPPIENLDELPMPAWDYFANLPYNWGGNWLPDAPVFTMNTSRGCPFDCTFCSVGSIWGRRYTYFSAERIIADIEYVIKHHGAKGIYFREDNFTLNKKRLYTFCNLMIEKGLNVPWVCETRASSLDRETVELMARAGAKGAYIGVESGSQRLLNFLQKDIKVEDVRLAFELCHEFEINTAASIVVGVPTETKSDLQLTRKLLDDIKPTITWFNVFVGIPKSKLYHYVLDNNLHEFIDDRGLVYLKGHSERVKEWYGDSWDATLPIKIKNGKVCEPRLSVIMPVYNTERFLVEAVHSLQRSSFNDFELIVINDASTDRTLELLETFNDPRIRIVSNEKKLGLAKSLNLGMGLAVGEYLAMMEACDQSHPLRFEKQMDFLDRSAKCALIGSSYNIIDEKSVTISAGKCLVRSEHIKAGLKYQNLFCDGSVMLRRAALEVVGHCNEDLLSGQCYDLWLRVSARFEVAILDEALYFLRDADPMRVVGVDNNRILDIALDKSIVVSSEDARRVDKLVQQGEDFFAYGKLEAAIESFQEAMSVNPGDQDAINNLGVIAFQLGMLDCALVLFERALDVNPLFALALENIGQCLKDLGRESEAERYLEQLAAVAPSLH